MSKNEPREKMASISQVQPASVDRFVQTLFEDLPSPVGRVAVPAACQAKNVSTILRACGRRRGATSFWEELADAIRNAGLYVDHDLTQPGLRGTERIRFSRVPFDEPVLTFSREASLARFVESAIGRPGGPFASLQTIPRVPAREHRLPNGRRIDILCRERGNMKTLVAIELKAGPPEREVVTQVQQYLREMRRMDPDQKTRGVIVSGPARSSDAEHQVRQAREDGIDWYFYYVAFEPALSWFDVAD